MYCVAGEIRLTAFVAEHNLPFMVMEHLPNLIKTICPDSKIAYQIRCSKTKTNAIIQHITGKTSFNDLCDDLRQNKFFLTIDESTERSTIKHLCLVVLYVKNYHIQDCFLGLISLEDANAATLFEHTIYMFIKNNIPYKTNLIGFASDGANVMIGSKNSAVVMLKNEIPNLFVMKCICHSFHLCASYACKKNTTICGGSCKRYINIFRQVQNELQSLRSFREQFLSVF